MAEAKRDQNNVTTLLAVSSVDGVTPVNVYVDPVSHRLLVDGSAGGIAIGGTVTGGTTGSVLFVGAAGALSQDNANFFYDDSTDRLGLATNTPEATLHVNGDIVMTSGTRIRGPAATSINTYISLENTGIGANGITYRVANGSNPHKWLNSATETMRLTSAGLTLVTRFLSAQATVASANDITLGNANAFSITGTTQINTIVATGWTAGSMITLSFAAAVTVKNATAGTGAQLRLAGGVDFSATADDNISFFYNGTTWNEYARTVI